MQLWLLGQPVVLLLTTRDNKSLTCFNSITLYVSMTNITYTVNLILTIQSIYQHHEIIYKAHHQVQAGTLQLMGILDPVSRGENQSSDLQSRWILHQLMCNEPNLANTELNRVHGLCKLNRNSTI